MIVLEDVLSPFPELRLVIDGGHQRDYTRRNSQQTQEKEEHTFASIIEALERDHT